MPLLVNIILVFTLLLGYTVHGRSQQQDSFALSNNYKFQDGIYLRHQSFRADEPDLRWEDFSYRFLKNPRTDMVIVREWTSKLDGQAVVADSIWGFTRSGIPFIRLERSVHKRQLPVFVPLKVRGHICYFDYEVEQVESVEIKAYNPVTGQPFREGTVERKVPRTVEKMMLFESGQVRRLNREALLEWIEPDKKLHQTLLGLEAAEADGKLLRCLKIFDDRNPVFIVK